MRALETKIAVLEDRQARLDPAIKELTLVVSGLKTAVDSGRGAIWIMLLLGSALGVIGTWVADFVRH